MSTLNFNKKHIPPSPPSWTCFLAENIYRQQAARGLVLTSSMLKQFRTCPALYRDTVRGIAKTPEKQAFRLGRAAHKLILEGEDACRAEFLVGGPLNEKTGRSFGHGSRAFARWLEEFGLAPDRIITPSEAADIRGMHAAVRAHPEASGLLSDGWPERSAEAGLAGLACRARFDWLRRDGLAVDLKTTADIGRFEEDARRFGYLHQFAFYREVARLAGAGDLRMAAVVVEKQAPFRVGVWHFPEAVLAPYAAENAAAIASLKRCLATDSWPTGYESARNFPAAAFALPRVWLN